MIACLFCNEGKFVSKRKIAEMLWERLPEANALDNFYKTYKRLTLLPELGIPLQIETLRGKIRLDFSNITSDVQQFDAFYQQNAIAAWEKALALYRGPLLRDEYYGWTTLLESHYDLRRTELFEKILTHYKQTKNTRKLAFYRHKWENEF